MQLAVEPDGARTDATDSLNRGSAAGSWLDYGVPEEFEASKGIICEGRTQTFQLDLCRI